MGIASLITSDLRRQDDTKRKKIEADILQKRIGGQSARDVATIQGKTDITETKLKEEGGTHRQNLAIAGDKAIAAMDNTAKAGRQDSVNATHLKKQKMAGTQRLDELDESARLQDDLDYNTHTREQQAGLAMIEAIPQMNANDYNYQYTPESDVALPPGTKKKKDPYDNVLVMP